MSKRRIKGLHYIADSDPKRYRDRTVKPERGRGRKDRPRKKGWNDDSGPVPFYSLTYLS